MMEQIFPQLALFDYNALDTETCAFVQERTRDIKTLIKKTAHDIFSIGGMLTEVKDRLGHGKFYSWLRSEFDWGNTTAWRFMLVFDKFKSSNLEDLKIAPSALYLLASPSTPDYIRDQVIERAENGETISHRDVEKLLLPTDDDKPQVTHITEKEYPQEIVNNLFGKITTQSVVDEMQGKPRPEVVHVSDDSYEWYTPKEYIDAVRHVLGWISLDPASCAEANEIVMAETFFTKDDDGLAQDWFGRVFLNPPYNMPLVEQFTGRAIREYENADIEEAIILVNNATDAGWFHALLGNYHACFTRGRVKFWTTEGPNLGARQGQVFFYLGRNPHKFAEVFNQFGIVVLKYDHQ
jgi:hypothetical protein